MLSAIDKRLSLFPAVIMLLGLAQPAEVPPPPPSEPAQVDVVGDAITIRSHGDAIVQGTIKNREALVRATVTSRDIGWGGTFKH
jgi:hypothetical protein